FPFPLFFECSRHHPHLHSFPTRRSSDLPDRSRSGACVCECCLKTTRVEVMGLEPLTLCLQSRCATNCAIPPCGFSPSHRIGVLRSEEHTSELQSRFDLVCRLLLEKKKQQ